ncbi:MAG TPA: hypothetical protein VL326_28135 [Kofleriaceae bacterium]|nr:hypothetical protein [Kofleriaceae bacterium]
MQHGFDETGVRAEVMRDQRVTRAGLTRDVFEPHIIGALARKQALRGIQQNLAGDLGRTPLAPLLTLAPRLRPLRPCNDTIRPRNHTIRPRNDTIRPRIRSSLLFLYTPLFSALLAHRSQPSTITSHYEVQSPTLLAP